MSDALKIIGVTVGTPQNPEKITKGYVPESRKIAGLELSGDITSEDLKEVLELAFVNAGKFFTLAELARYDFKTNYFYKVSIASTITTSDNVEIPIGDYICDCTNSNPDNKWVSLIPNIPNGIYWSVCLSNKTGHKVDYVNNEVINDIISYVEEELATKLNVSVFAEFRTKWETRLSNAENSINNITTSLGNIDTALDELHTYAQSLISGGAAE